MQYFCTHVFVRRRRDACERHGPAGLDFGQRRHHVCAHIRRDDHLMVQTFGSDRISGRTRVIARVRPLHGPQTEKIHWRLVATAAAR